MHCFGYGNQLHVFYSVVAIELIRSRSIHVDLELACMSGDAKGAQMVRNWISQFQLLTFRGGSQLAPRLADR